MGTRSLTYIYEDIQFAKNPNKLEPITCIYCQFDGYPTGIGADIKECLGNAKVVNGLPAGSKDKLFNMMGDLAAMLIYYLKKGDNGNVYVRKPELNVDGWQEYEYHIRSTKDGTICLTVKNSIDEIWRGTIDDFDPEALEKSLRED